MRSFALKGCVVSVKSRDEALLHRLFQAQVLHSVLDLHVLTQIVDGLRDKLRQPKSVLVVLRRARRYTCRCSWSSPPTSSLVNGPSTSSLTANSASRGLADELLLNIDVMRVCVSRIARSSGETIASVTAASNQSYRRQTGSNSKGVTYLETEYSQEGLKAAP